MLDHKPINKILEKNFLTNKKFVNSSLVLQSKDVKQEKNTLNKNTALSPLPYKGMGNNHASLQKSCFCKGLHDCF